MVLPLADDNSDRKRFPVVTIALIVINLLVFAVGQEFATKDDFTFAWAMVPEEIRTGKNVPGPVEVEDPLTGRKVPIPLQPTPISVYLTLLTSMFLHGGVAHVLGNMWFLWIFGDNVEDTLGRFRFILFYLATGLLASLAHIGSTYAFQMNPYIPALGASGAISGIMGAYLVLFPHKRVLVLLFRIIVSVPAYVVVGIWFLFQLINGLGMLGGETGGVAYGAHIGGFVAGVALVFLFRPRQ